MKSLILLITICAGFNGLAEIIPAKSLPTSGFYVVKDEPGPGVPNGKVFVNGWITDPMTGDTLKDVLVATLDREKETYTNEHGYYQLLLDADDTSMFAFKSQHEEHVIWNYNFKSGHHVQINFSLTEDWDQLEMDKPVIYMYSNKPVEANVTFNVDGEVTFTYPEYKEGWDVNVSKDGILHNGKKFPYLFWEGIYEDASYLHTQGGYKGSFIKTDTTIEFLESTLSKLGLNDEEQADFITYWTPKMEKRDYAFVTFLIDDQVAKKISELKVKPTPDSQRRIYMLYTHYDNDAGSKSIKPQEYPEFNRKGFTVIEWGGSEVKKNFVINYDTVDK